MLRPQFTLRASLFGILLVANLFQWIEQEVRIVRERQTMVEFQNGSPGDFLKAESASERQLSKISWLREQLGDQAIVAILYRRMGDRGQRWLRKATRLFPEAEVIETQGFQCKTLSVSPPKK
jgi:hypothetical protein